MADPCPVPYSPDEACDCCGKFGVFAFDGESLCGECYQGRGSCCAETEQKESGPGADVSSD